MLAAWIRKKRKVVGMTIAPRPRTEIDAIAESWVDELVVLAPTLGTYIGRSEVDGRMPDLSPEGAGAFAEVERRTLASLERAAPVDAVDEVTKADLAAELRLSLARHEAGEELRDLNDQFTRIGKAFYHVLRRWCCSQYLNTPCQGHITH